MGFSSTSSCHQQEERKDQDQRQISSVWERFLKVIVLLSFRGPEPDCLAMMQGRLGNVDFVPAGLRSFIITAKNYRVYY